MKKRLIIISTAVVFFVICIIAGIALLNSGSFGISSGICLKSDNDTCFLISKNSPIRLSDMGYSTNKTEKLKTGDKIIAFHTGINESYPASTGLYFCIKLGNGNEADIPKAVISSLQELGWINKDNIQNEEKKLVFSDKYLRTSHNGEKSGFPYMQTVKTYEELVSYLESNKEIFYLGEEFNEAIKDYDREFFKDNIIVISVLEEGSGSVSHLVEKVTENKNGEIEIHIKRNVPEVGTCDMAYHHIFTAVSKEDVRDKSIRLFIDNKDVTKKWERVSVNKEFANFSLFLPENWDYEEYTVTEDGSFGINFFNKNAPESVIALEFLDGFGVCGTGLRTQELTINGYKAHKGIYDGNPNFDYILFENTPGFYVIKNCADGTWWNKYGEEANEIIETIKIAEGIIFREEALTIAAKHATGEYKRQYSEFDTDTGIWSFNFESNEISQIIQIDKNGNMLCHIPKIDNTH